VAAEPAEVRTYGNWRRPMSPGLGQLGMIGTGALMAGLIVVVLTTAFVGLMAGAVVAVVLGAALSTLVIRDPHGRTLLQRAAVRIAWTRSRSRRAHLYRSGPLGQVPWGTFALPGVAARSSLSEHRDSYDRPFALVHLPGVNHYTVVFATDPDGSSLVDASQVDLWVAHWGQWLGDLGDEPGMVGASVTVETAPDSGARLQREVFGRMDDQAPVIARAMLEEVVQSYPAGSATVKAWIALTFSGAGQTEGRRRSTDEVATDLAARIAGLGQRLQATGAGAARPVDAQQLCEVIRIAYDPPAARLIDMSYSDKDVPALSWDDVGPTAHQEGWGEYRHDGALSVSWSMTMPPRSAVQSSVLEKLLAPHRAIARKRVTLVFRTMDSAQAANRVESDKNAADFRATSQRRPSARAMREQKCAAANARDEADGAGLVNFGMIVTATVAAAADLPQAVTAIDDLSATARIRLRRVYGSQASAFAACLPLGIVLPHHLKVPSAVREAL